MYNYIHEVLSPKFASCLQRKLGWHPCLCSCWQLETKEPHWPESLYKMHNNMKHVPYFIMQLSGYCFHMKQSLSICSSIGCERTTLELEEIAVKSLNCSTGNIIFSEFLTFRICFVWRYMGDSRNWKFSMWIAYCLDEIFLLIFNNVNVQKRSPRWSSG